MKICVIIPVYNEAKGLGAVLDRLKATGLQVVVVDDGSKDASTQIAKEKGASVIQHEKNKGKGASLQNGFKYAVLNHFDGVITMDGDGQHEVSDIDAFLAAANSIDKPDIVTGTRMQNPKGMPVVRLWTNRAMSFLISSLCKQKVPDTQCGFRFIRCSVLEKIQLTSCDYEIETEVLIKASKQGCKIISVPIQSIYRDEASKINPLLDTWRFFVYIVKEMCSPKN